VKVAHSWSGYLLALLGVVHASLALPSLVRSPDYETVWFAGTGLGLLLLVFLNVAFRRAPQDPVVRRLCHGSNLAFSLFGVAGALAVPEPQAYAVLLCILVQTASALGMTSNK
jgi:hypothetical protein